MSPWLTLVIGVILGLLIGWLIDLFYRRRDSATRGEAVETRTAPPDWVAPPPAAPVQSEVAKEVSAVALEEPVAPDLPELPQAPSAPEPPVPPDEPAAEALVALDHGGAVEWPEVSEQVAAVAAPESSGGPVAPRVADELPANTGGLPPAAVEALAPGALGSGPVRSAQGRDKLIVIEGIGPVYERKLNDAGINTFRQLAEADEDRLREIIQPQTWQRVVFAEWIEQASLLAEGKDEELRALQARLFSRKKGQE